MDEILIFKLISGEELISKVKSYEDKWINLDNPRILAMHPKEGLQLVPLMMMADKSQQMSLMRTSITSFTDKIQEQIKEAYCEETSLILTPSKKILMG